MWCRTVLSFSLLPFVFPLSQFPPVPLFFLCVRCSSHERPEPEDHLRQALRRSEDLPEGDGPDTLPRARVGGVAKSKDSTVCSGRSARALPRRPRRILNDVVERL
uniref:Putative secreted protein n=1 Tax=Ixodes ricinus TaxID=34613 RepID=A0A6B0UGD8_IXORI